MYFLATMAEKKCIKCWLTRTTLAAVSIKYGDFPLGSSRSLEILNGFLQIIATVCYFSSQTSSYSSSTYSTSSKTKGRNVKQASCDILPLCPSLQPHSHFLKSIHCQSLPVHQMPSDFFSRSSHHTGITFWHCTFKQTTDTYLWNNQKYVSHQPHIMLHTSKQFIYTKYASTLYTPWTFTHGLHKQTQHLWVQFY